MRRTVIGAGAGIAIWLGAALAAEAQIIIQPTGPTAVYRTQTSSTYTATITCNNNFWVRLKVYLNGVIKHDTNTFVANSGPSYNFSKVVNMTGWGLKAGDTLLYRGRATISGQPGVYDKEDWTVIVSNPSTYLAPDRVRPPEIDRDREEWA